MQLQLLPAPLQPDGKNELFSCFLSEETARISLAHSSPHLRFAVVSADAREELQEGNMDST